MRNYSNSIFALCILLVSSCAKDEIINTSSTRVLFKGECSIAEVYWMPDNTHIIMNDFCGGTIPYLNVLSGTVQNLSILPGYVIQRIFVSPEIPDYLFCLALRSGSASIFFELFSFNVTTGATLLIKDGIEANPITSRYLVGGHRLAISGDPIQIINFKTGNSSILPSDGKVMAFSPDGSQLLYYSQTLGGGQTPITGAWLYDFTCECTTSIAINTYPGGVIWNTIGQYGLKSVAADTGYFSLTNLLVTDLLSGMELAVFLNYNGGPWYNSWDTTGLYFTEEPDASEEERLVLNEYDFKSATHSVICKARSSSTYPFIGNRQLAISPDGKKIAFVEWGSILRGFW